MPVTITVTDDRKEFDAVRKRLAGFDLAAMVGLHDEELATIGWRHEDGDGVARRPWIGPAADLAVPKLTTRMEAEAGKVSDGAQTARGAVTDVGDQAAQAIKLYVEGGEVKGKALSDAAKRKDSRKLIHDGDMVEAVESKIVKTSEAET